jgi:hypothetical protein
MHRDEMCPRVLRPVASPVPSSFTSKILRPVAVTIVKPVPIPGKVVAL